MLLPLLFKETHDRTAASWQRGAIKRLNESSVAVSCSFELTVSHGRVHLEKTVLDLTTKLGPAKLDEQRQPLFAS